MLKKYFNMFVSILLTATMLTACGQTASSDGVFKTFKGDAGATADTNNQSDGDLSNEDGVQSIQNGKTPDSSSSGDKTSSSGQFSSGSPSSSSSQVSSNSHSSAENQSSSGNQSSAENKVDRTNGVIVELIKKKDNKGTYEDFYIYVRTDDPTGKYYIRYNFIYEYNTEISNEANSTKNVDAFRIKEAHLTEVTNVTATSVDKSDICTVLQQGEISLAVKENNTNDYLGGYHGDDHMTEFKLTVGGKEYIPGKANEVIVCDTVKIHQVDILNRCGKANDDVLKHTQEYTIDMDGVKTNKKVEWLTDNFNLYQAYLQMFTMYRVVNNKTVCEKVATYDGEGNFLASKTISGTISSGYHTLENTNIREVRYSSKTSGISAKVGFDIVGNSVAVKSALINVRTQGDNKWYANFCPVNGSNPKAGEFWEINTYFDIDYIAP